jgi:transcriptional regulator with XRE-family HTH domain
MEFYKKLLEFLLENRITLIALSKQLEVSYLTVKLWAYGKSLPSIQNLKKLEKLGFESTQVIWSKK